MDVCPNNRFFQSPSMLVTYSDVLCVESELKTAVAINGQCLRKVVHVDRRAIPPTSWYYSLWHSLPVPLNSCKTGARFFQLKQISKSISSQKMMHVSFDWGNILIFFMLHPTTHLGIPFQPNQGSQGLPVSWWRQGWVSNSNGKSHLERGGLVGRWVSFWGVAFNRRCLCC